MEKNEVRFTNDDFETPICKIAYRHALKGKTAQHAAAPPLIIYCGGNSFDVPNHGDLAIWKALAHGDVLVWDYPGFGQSEGKAKISDFRAATNSLAQNIQKFQRSREQKIVLWGHSLGGFVCSELANHLAKLSNFESLIFETSAPSAKAAKKYFVPWYVKPFIQIKLDVQVASYDNIQTLSGQNLKILILAARKDQILPVKLSRQMRDELRSTGHRVTYHEFKKADHFNVGFEESLTSIVANFLQ